jgi:hypothetical protein
MRACVFLFLLIFSLPLSRMSAEAPDSVQERSRVGMYIAIGYIHSSLGDFNDATHGYGFEKVSSSHFPGVFGLRIRTAGFTTSLSLEATQMTRLEGGNAEIRELHRSVLSYRLYFNQGLPLFQRDRHLVQLRLDFGFGRTTFTSASREHFNAILEGAHLYRTEIAQDYMVVRVGLQYEFSTFLWTTPSPIGLHLGYSFPVYTMPWQSNPVEIDGGPKTRIEGFGATLMLPLAGY